MIRSTMQSFRRLHCCGGLPPLTPAAFARRRVCLRSVPALAPKVMSSLHGNVARGKPSQASQRRQRQRERDYTKAGPLPGAKSQGSSASASGPSSSAGGSGAAPTAPPASSRGRFTRIARERGLGFAATLYVMGEGLTWALVYALHTHALPIGDVGTWAGLLVGRDTAASYLNVGPTVLGGALQLSPRLALNYLLCTTLMVPVFPYTYALCVALTPLARRVLGAVTPARRARSSAIPKAPPANSGG